jgi:hypothetical protein
VSKLIAAIQAAANWAPRSFTILLTIFAVHTKQINNETEVKNVVGNKIQQVNFCHPPGKIQWPVTVLITTR